MHFLLRTLEACQVSTGERETLRCKTMNPIQKWYQISEHDKIAGLVHLSNLHTATARNQRTGNLVLHVWQAIHTASNQSPGTLVLHVWPAIHTASNQRTGNLALHVWQAIYTASDLSVWLAQLVKAQPSAACVHVQSCMTVREVLSSTPGQTGSPNHASFSGS